MLLASALTLQACSDILNEDPKGKHTPGNFFASQNDLDESLYALYEQVNHTQNYTNPGYPQWQGDDITANPGSNKQACAESDRFAMSNTNKGVVAAWKQFYGLIKRANFIINNVDKAPITDEEKNIT